MIRKLGATKFKGVTSHCTPNFSSLNLDAIVKTQIPTAVFEQSINQR